MAHVDWSTTSRLLITCNCDWGCPCQFNARPTHGDCRAAIAGRIDEGHFGDVRLDGLTWVALFAWPGAIHEGNGEALVVIDERADERQREALQMIFGGQAGGWPATLAELIGEVRGIEFAQIEVEVAGDLAHWHAEVPGKVVARAEALGGPTTPPGQRVQLLNPPGSEVGPGQVATWGTATTQQVDAFGFSSSLSGKSSKHIPFDWNGPGPA